MNLNKCITSTLNALERCMYRHISNIENVEYCECSYKKNNEPPKDDYKPYDLTVTLDKLDGYYWFRTELHTPSIESDEYLVLRMTTGREGAWDATNPQGILYLNGKMTQGFDTNHREAYLEPNTDYTLHNYFYIGLAAGNPIRCEMALYAVNSRIEKLYYDLKVPFDSCQILREDSDEAIKTMSVLVDAVRLLDMRDVSSNEFFTSVETTIAFLEKEFYEKLCSTEGKPVINCIGHTHIDVEWKWNRDQTREKIQRSFSTAKALMDKYPEYKFMLSQPELYRYLKEEAPEKYEELKELVNNGRWEPEGSMYVEPDCNLTSGESLIRQIIHGKRFFKEEFGVDNKVLFLPDVFGYSAALPQILKKCGVEHFVTSKISWNDTNKMPVDTFIWEGIDGTELFTTFITEQDVNGLNGKDKQRTTYNGFIKPTRVKGTWDRFGQKEYCDQVLMTFGFGDGGGGPTKEMLENQRRLSKGLPGMPVTKIGFLSEHLDTMREQFEKNCKRTSRIPKWVGELYLEYHRGTYTSIAKVKKGNRKSEFLLGNTEALSITDLCFGGSYDADGLNKAWRRVLHNQFHDILPGSSIKSVYDYTDIDYKMISDYGNSVIDEKLDSISKKISTSGGVLLYNPTGFERKAVITINGEYCETNDTVAPFGWKVVRPEKAENRIKLCGLCAENDYYKLVINDVGQICELYDKENGRNVIKSGTCGNVLNTYYDDPTKYDAWEIEDYYVLSKRTIDTKATITPIVDGTRAGFVIEREYMHSNIKQIVWLYSQSRRIDFDTELDWHDHHQILKAEFPFDVHATSATYDVQFGHVTRPTHRNTSWDEAKFEVYAHKWMDIAENGYGVALLNDCKYGHSVNGSTVSLTLLKCPTDPCPDADEGKHTFTYSILPHANDFRDASVIDASWELNQPLYERQIDASSGVLPESFSLVSADAKNVVITAVKRAENDNGLIVRLHDAYDKKSIVTLCVPKDFTKAAICDMLENEVETIAINDGKVTFPLSNFEIVTLKFSK